MRRLSLSVSLLAALLLPAGEGAVARDAGPDAGVVLRYLDAPAPGGALLDLPRLNVSFGGAVVPAVMDTGSTGVVISADKIPNADHLRSLGPGAITYSSSGRIMEGRWLVTTITIAGANGVSVTTRPLPVLAVDRIACTETARSCTPQDRPTHVAMLGVGFGREYDRQPQGTPDHNPFLNLATPSRGTITGYVLTRYGVTLGAPPASARADFVLVKHARDARYPDWAAGPACITVAATTPTCGAVLVDTGVAGMFLTVPPDRLTSVATSMGGKWMLMPGTRIAVALAPDDRRSAAGFAFDVGGSRDPVAPSTVTLSGVGRRSTFVNTSFHLLNRYDYLFDADGGWIGYRLDAPSRDGHSTR